MKREYRKLADVLYLAVLVFLMWAFFTAGTLIGETILGYDDCDVITFVSVEPVKEEVNRLEGIDVESNELVVDDCRSIK